MAGQDLPSCSGMLVGVTCTEPSLGIAQSMFLTLVHIRVPGMILQILVVPRLSSQQIRFSVGGSQTLAFFKVPQVTPVYSQERSCTIEWQGMKAFGFCPVTNTYLDVMWSWTKHFTSLSFDCPARTERGWTKWSHWWFMKWPKVLWEVKSVSPPTELGLCDLLTNRIWWKWYCASCWVSVLRNWQICFWPMGTLIFGTQPPSWEEAQTTWSGCP